MIAARPLLDTAWGSTAGSGDQDFAHRTALRCAAGSLVAHCM